MRMSIVSAAFAALVVAVCGGDEAYAARSEHRSALLDIRTAKVLLAREHTERQQCVTGRGRRVRNRNCSTVAAVVGIPGTGRMGVVRFRWGDAVFLAEPYAFTRVGASKGVNTHYRVDVRKGKVFRNAGHAILAWKIPIRGRSTGQWRDVVYTPYSTALHRPEVIAEGRRYFRAQMALGRALLERRRVRSLAAPDLLVTDVVQQATTATIALVEKIDHAEFERCQGDRSCMRRLIDVVRVVIGANGRHAYTYAVSRAGARGFMQFTPPTWESMRRQYPAARLPSFSGGSTEHAASVMAAILLNDYNLTLLTVEHATTLRRNAEAFTLYAAAAYNGNPKWAIRAIAQCSTAWMMPTCAPLRRETRVYLRKVLAIWPIVVERPRTRLVRDGRPT